MSTASGTGSIPGGDKALRGEIIASQKSQADFLKWKLISVAAVASVSLGFALPGSAAGDGAKLLLCLIPLICLYVDLISLHIMLRNVAIGTYLKLSGNPYERFVFEVRVRSATNPFLFEALAIHGSSSVFNIIILALGFLLPVGPNWPQDLLTAYIVAGGLGFVATVILWLVYNSRVAQMISEAEKAFPVSQSPHQ